MADGLTLLTPSIDAANLTPNPVSINARITLSITVTEKTIYLEPAFFYAGEVFSGEA